MQFETLFRYAVLANTAVNNTGQTQIQGGNVGVSPEGTVNGLTEEGGAGPGIVVRPGTIHINDADAATAKNELVSLNAAISAFPSGITLPFTELGGQDIFPGVYDFEPGSNVTINGTLTLAGTPTQDQPGYFFRIPGTLTTGTDSVVIFESESSITCNVIWQVGDSVTLGTNSSFLGQILAQNSITANTNAVISLGTLFSSTGTVTMNTNLIRNLDCVNPSFFPQPTITNIIAESTPEGGTRLTIIGTGFFAVTGISLNGNLIPFEQFEQIDDTQIIVTVPPPGLSGTVTVTVLTRGGDATGQVVISQPGSVFIACISPHKGSTRGGTVVSIFGLGFTGTTSVSFNDTPALSFIQNSDNQITAVSPPHVAGNVLVTVTTPLGSASFPFKFVRKCDKCGKTICDDRIICDKNKTSKHDKCDKKPKPDKCNKKLEHDKCNKKLEHYIPLVRDKFTNKFKQTKRCVRCNGFVTDKPKKTS